ncbi:MAG: protein-L-isoaspartate(D-aspartate) O-methyltransferase [Dehalococcoidia bacterium]
MELEQDLERAKRVLLESLRREIDDERVLQAMDEVPREDFVSEANRHLAYEDIPLPIGEGQTISQPYIVALMTSALQLQETDRVLELGTGSGYQAAILAKLVPRGRVLTLERISTLAHTARTLLRSLGLQNVEARQAGKALGCPQEAPFDAILVTAGAPRLPRELLEQLAPGGRMVIPIGSLQEQQLTLVVKTGEGYSVKLLGACRFVPLLGQGAWSAEGPPGP